MAFGYVVPAEMYRTEIVVVNSRFISTISYGKSIIESMSDDGEPSGTAGPPVLAVLRGVDIGDTLVIVTRYFGGTLLGTGGLVRAYTEAAQAGLAGVRTQRKIERKMVGFDAPYTFYQPLHKLLNEYEAVDVEETFAGDVTITARFPVDNIEPFIAHVIDLTSGVVQPVTLE